MYDMADRCEMALFEEEKRKRKLPVCDTCHEPIYDDFRYEIDGYCLCEDCFTDYANDNFRVRNDYED